MKRLLIFLLTLSLTFGFCLTSCQTDDKDEPKDSEVTTTVDDTTTKTDTTEPDSTKPDTTVTDTTADDTTTNPDTTVTDTTVPDTTKPDTTVPDTTKPETTKPEETAPPATQHKHSYTAKVTAPTCDSQGYTTYTCTCGANYRDNYKSNLSHSWGEWTTVQEPANGVDGKAVRKCKLCNLEDTKVLPFVFESDTPLLVGMANQTNKCVEVYDISTGKMNAATRKWSFRTNCSTISGFKLRNHPTKGKVVLIVGGEIAEMVSYDTKTVLWKTTNSSANGHSIELLPNGVIVTGGTVGNDLHFYNPNGSNPTKILKEIPFPNAHGLLWDPKYEVLWAVGDSDLTAFEVTLNADGTVTVTEKESLSFVVPDTDIHDLQPYTGNDDWLILSTTSHVYIYDKVNKTVKDAYTGISNAPTDHVKGVGRFENGDMFYMFYDGGNDNGQGGGWNTTYLTYIRAGATSTFKVPSDQGRFYKCRAWYADYQP